MTSGVDPFNNPKVQEAILHAVLSAELTVQIVPDQNIKGGDLS